MRWRDSFPLDSITCENHENPAVASGDFLKMIESNSPQAPGAHAGLNSDEAFQKLLLRIAARAAERADPGSLIQLFCRASREFFQVSGVYFWRRHSGDELVGEQANGKLADRFAGIRLLPQQSTVTADAVRRRRAVVANYQDLAAALPALQPFEGRALMAAPLVVFEEVIGAVTF